MKKLYIVITFILSSFFLSSYVSADNYNYTLTDNDFNSLNSLDYIKSSVENYTSNPYAILYRIEQNNYFVMIYNSIPYVFYSSPNWYLQRKTGQMFCNVSSDFSLSCSSSSSAVSFYPNFLLVYSSFDVFLSNSSDIVIFNYNDNLFNSSLDCSNCFPSIYQLYSFFNSSPPTPPDPYPILTSFYTTFIDRLGYVADYISQHYMYLSIFVIFIFMFCILLLRRLKR